MSTAYVTPTTGINSIDSLLSGESWVPTPGTPLTVTYGFMTQLPSYYGNTYDAYGFAAMTANQQRAVVAALASWAAVANITFVPVASGGTIEFGTNNQGSSSAAYTYEPQTGAPGGFVYLNNRVYTGSSNFAVGTYGFEVLVHEIGHALGFKHPGNYNAGGGGTPGPYLPSSTDNRAYTIMSYNQPTGVQDNINGPMMYDIAAMQYLYGANTSSPGSHTYSFGDSVSGLQSIWDPGPNNTIDASASTRAVTVNMNGGTFSTIGAGPYDSAYTPNDVSLAVGTVIQHVKTGAGNDTITVNALNDSVDGGGGANTVVFNGPRSEYTVTTDHSTTGTGALVSTVTDSLNGQPSAVITNGSTLAFSDQSLAIAAVATSASNFVSAQNLYRGSNGIALEYDASASSLQAGKNAVIGFQSANFQAGDNVMVLNGPQSLYSFSVGTNGALSVTNTLTQQTVADTGISYILFNGGATSAAGAVTGYAGIYFIASGADAQIASLYQGALGRLPDLPGLEYWEGAYAGSLGRMSGAQALSAIAQGFVGSAEFQTRFTAAAAPADAGGPADTAFVTALYHNVLGRAPDAIGLAYWVQDLLASETAGAMTGLAARSAVLLGFTGSTEYLHSISAAGGGWLIDPTAGGYTSVVGTAAASAHASDLAVA